MPGVAQQSSELLDVVDRNDVVVETLTRGEIHRRQLMHRAVHILVFSASGDLLLQKRSMQKDEMAGYWDSSCAGHVESGQAYLETAVRELDEELGVLVSEQTLDYLFTMRPQPSNGMEFAAVYRLVHDGPFSAADDEIDELAWRAPAEITRWIDDGAEQLTSGFVQIWERYQSMECS
jgi:isopentenyldiphosphate isomerase